MFSFASGLRAQTDTLSAQKDSVPAFWIDVASGDTVYSKADSMPSFPGGEMAFQRFLIENLRYPHMEKEQGHSGTVYISFRVEKDGTISNVKCKKGVEGAPGLGKEGVRVLSLMPDWESGTINGRPVNVEMVIPIKFTLEEKKKRRG